MQSSVHLQKSKQPGSHTLLVCGILSSLLYLTMNVVAALLYKGYDSVTYTVSELSAIGAPTRPLWVALGLLYGLLVTAFALGMRLSARNRPQRITAVLLLVYGLLSLYWPPMHQRAVLAAGGGTLTDTLHIVFSAIVVPLMVLVLGFGSRCFEKGFKIYSISSLVALVVFGVLISRQAAALAKDLHTPTIGLWERLNIGVFLVWVVILSIRLIKQEKHGRQPYMRHPARNTRKAASAKHS